MLVDQLCRHMLGGGEGGVPAASAAPATPRKKQRLSFIQITAPVLVAVVVAFLRLNLPEELDAEEAHHPLP